MLGGVDTEGSGTLESSPEEEGSEVLTGGDVSEAVAGVERNEKGASGPVNRRIVFGQPVVSVKNGPDRVGRNRG